MKEAQNAVEKEINEVFVTVGELKKEIDERNRSLNTKNKLLEEAETKLWNLRKQLEIIKRMPSI